MQATAATDAAAAGVVHAAAAAAMSDAAASDAAAAHDAVDAAASDAAAAAAAEGGTNAQQQKEAKTAAQQPSAGQQPQAVPGSTAAAQAQTQVRKGGDSFSKFAALELGGFKFSGSWSAPFAPNATPISASASMTATLKLLKQAELAANTASAQPSKQATPTDAAVVPLVNIPASAGTKPTADGAAAHQTSASNAAARTNSAAAGPPSGQPDNSQHGKTLLSYPAAPTVSGTAAPATTSAQQLVQKQPDVAATGKAASETVAASGAAKPAIQQLKQTQPAATVAGKPAAGSAAVPSSQANTAATAAKAGAAGTASKAHPSGTAATAKMAGTAASAEPAGKGLADVAMSAAELPKAPPPPPSAMAAATQPKTGLGLATGVQQQPVLAVAAAKGAVSTSTIALAAGTSGSQSGTTDSKPASDRIPALLKKYGKRKWDDQGSSVAAPAQSLGPSGLQTSTLTVQAPTGLQTSAAPKNAFAGPQTSAPPGQLPAAPPLSATALPLSPQTGAVHAALKRQKVDSDSQSTVPSRNCAVVVCLPMDLVH